MGDPQEFDVSPTSRTTADVEDIVLRETERVRLVFRPMLVVNPNDREACLRGEFRYQKKTTASSWVDCETRSLSGLRAEDGGFKLELRAGEVKTLLDRMNQLRAVFQQEGISVWPETYTVASGQMGQLLQSILGRREELTALEPDSIEVLQLLIEVLVKTEEPLEVARVLSGTGADALSRLGAASQVAQLESLLKRWRDNLDNADEGWWQREFVDNSWVLPQVFGQPFVLLQGQAFMGGKRIDNTGGHVLDLAFRNALTDNVALVEIKTPITPLLGARMRAGIWAFSPELSGSVTQLLSYKDDLQKEYYERAGTTRRAGGEHFEVFNPRCVLLAGNLTCEADGDGEKIRCIDLARNDFRSVEIVSYDELLMRLELLLRALLNTTLDEQAHPQEQGADGAEIQF